MPNPICLRLLKQLVRRAFSRALAKTGNKIDARIDIMAITTNSSMSVNACRFILLPPKVLLKYSKPYPLKYKYAQFRSLLNPICLVDFATYTY